uniref:Ubiquitin-like protease family profile domain-containing protein n=1 Tax=Noccaea caerulescens TaxID=107243 RepID=A0A1J3GZG7_NOCCA
MLLSMLKRSKNLGSEIRVKYACLLLVDGMLCRRSSPMKIPREHVEMIRDLQYFLSYPWCRFAFDMTMQCIKTRQINQLAQPTVAIQGFIHALQLVVIEAVPDAVSAVGDGSDIESGEEDSGAVVGLKLDRFWELDVDDSVAVTSIIEAGGEEGDDGNDLSWVDEVDDPVVEYMLKHIGEGFTFKREHFRGGQWRGVATASHVSRSAHTGKRKGKAPAGPSVSSPSDCGRGKKARKQVPTGSHVSLDYGKIAEMVADQIKEALAVAGGSFRSSLQTDLKEMEDRVLARLSSDVRKKVDDHMKSKYADVTIGGVLRDLSDTGVPGGDATASDAASEDIDDVVVPPGDLSSNAKFKHIVDNPAPTMTLDFGAGLALKDSDLINLPQLIPADTSTVMDSCVMLLRETMFTLGGVDSDMRADVMPSVFPSLLAKHHARFKKTSKKESFEFDADIMDHIRNRTEATGKEWVKHVDFIYFPFNLDKNRWVAVLVDLPSSSLVVFDPNASAVRRSRLKAEVDFLCVMLPFFIRKAASCDEMASFPLTPLTFSRDVEVLQVPDRRQSGIVSVMVIEAHASGGLPKVHAITEDMIRERAEKLAVEMYELCCGDIED